MTAFPKVSQMPQFFFDYMDGARAYPDDEGTELPGLKQARAEALWAIGGIAKDEIPGRDGRDIQISIREGAGPVIMVVSLAVRIENK
jgi:hypothetical protein